MSHSYEKTTQHSCPACSYGPFTRNNYFTGKLMVERDFTDETRFHMEKLRHHEQQLHGWGVVCGLKVKPHPNPACRDRYVCIEPGSAVDCCGHDIIVREEECIDLTQFPELKALQAKGDKEPHKLQICVRFRECPTEEIPVLYDDCGCDDTKCAPNRILESHEFGVLLDAKDQAEAFHTPRLKWENSIAIAHAALAALHDATHHVYVATADSPATVYQISTDNHATITSRTLPAKALAVAVANDGKHLYVVTEAATAANPRQLHVLDTTQPGMPDFNTNPADLPNSAGSDVILAVAPDGRLLALVVSTGDVLRGEPDLDTNANAAAPKLVKSLGPGVQGLALSSDGQEAFAAGPGNQIQALDLAAAMINPINVLPATAKPVSLAVISSTAPDMLAVIDQANLHLIALNPAPLLLGSVKLDHTPIAVVASTGGHWAYVLEKDTAGSSFVQSVSIDGLLENLPVQPGTEFKVGNDSRQIVISKSGTHFYVPFVDDQNQPTLGGVAIVEVSEEACSEILWRHLEGCPHCDLPDCVVLATIENYHLGDAILAPTDPPDPIDDLANKIARIDNRLGRHLLPSTQVLTELIQCLLEHGTGGAGTQGPPGIQGPKGDKGDKGDTVVGPQGPKGDDGPGLELGLTRIEALSWTHNKQHTGGTPPGVDSFFVMVDRPSGAKTPGIVIGFTDEVQVKATIDASHVFQVLVPSGDPNSNRGLLCHCPLRGTTVPVRLKLDAQGRIVVNATTGRIDFAAEVPANNARGVAFLLEIEFAREVIDGFVPDLWVMLRGDFVKDVKGRAIDAEFVRAELPTGDRPKPPAALPLAKQPGIQGGLFESWFTVKGG